MLTAPYNSAMRLGQGFNTYTHEICVNDAVVIDPDNGGGDEYGGSPDTVSQIVTYCTRHVEKVSDVTSAMNISAAASVKSTGAGGSLSGSFVDSSKFKESTINFFCQVKVVNQVIMARDVLKFNDIPKVTGSKDIGDFTKVYGDSFISGFLEGGELNAIISVKSSDTEAVKNIKAALEASFGKGTSPTSGSINADFGLDKESHLSSSETTITVNWTGGGNIKPKEDLWSIETLTKVAAAFPEMVKNTPQRTAAILTKYQNLRSFQMHDPPIPDPLDYTLAQLYTNDLLDAFMDYKNLWKEIHNLIHKLDTKKAKLIEAKIDQQEEGVDPKTTEHKQPAKLIDHHRLEQMTTEQKAKEFDKLNSKTTFTHPEDTYKPTIRGLAEARLHCRYEMGKILGEVTTIEKDPTLAGTRDPSDIFLDPALFRRLLPVEDKSGTSNAAQNGALATNGHANGNSPNGYDKIEKNGTGEANGQKQIKAN